MDPSALPLRDLHLPPPVGWWPPAPGWWLVAGLLLALTLLGAWAWWRTAPRRRLRHEALAELDRLLAAHRAAPDGQRLLQGVSALLRRVAIARWGRARVARLSGDRWLAFLDQRAGAPLLASGEARLLAEAPYRPDPPGFDAEALVAACRRWIQAVTGRRAEAAS